jgi:hypothetical protein
MPDKFFFFCPRHNVILCAKPYFIRDLTFDFCQTYFLQTLLIQGHLLPHHLPGSLSADDWHYVKKHLADKNKEFVGHLNWYPFI